MVAAAGALEMTGGQRAELERLARSHTAPAREVRQAKALLCPRTVFRTPRSLVGARPRRSLSVGGVAGSPRREPLRWGASGRGVAAVLGDDVVEAIVHDTLHTVRGRHDLRRGYLLHGGSSCPRGLGWRLSRSQRERTRREDRRSKFYEISDNLRPADGATRCLGQRR